MLPKEHLKTVFFNYARDNVVGDFIFSIRNDDGACVRENNSLFI